MLFREIKTSISGQISIESLFPKSSTICGSNDCFICLQVSWEDQCQDLDPNVLKLTKIGSNILVVFVKQ